MKEWECGMGRGWVSCERTCLADIAKAVRSQGERREVGETKLPFLKRRSGFLTYGRNGVATYEEKGGWGFYLGPRIPDDAELVEPLDACLVKPPTLVDRALLLEPRAELEAVGGRVDGRNTPLAVAGVRGDRFKGAQRLGVGWGWGGGWGGGWGEGWGWGWGVMSRV